MNLSVFFKSHSLSLSKNIIDESMSMGYIRVPEPLHYKGLNPTEPATNYSNDMDIDKNKGNSRISKSLKK
jgi:hypothetical protein